MIRALLDDANPKTQTRRPITMGNSLVDGRPPWRKQWPHLRFDAPEVFVDGGSSPAGNIGPYLHVPHDDGETRHRVYPRIEVGDRLWVRETWAPDRRAPEVPYVAVHRATDEVHLEARGATPDRWHPSIHMPRWASRITLEVTEVRAERLRSISEADAVAEGVHRGSGSMWQGGPHRVKEKGCKVFNLASEAFVDRFHAIYPGDDDPWVWATSFKRVLP